MPSHPDHWHFISGHIGCTPETNEVHETKTAALEALREHKAEYRECGYRFTRVNSEYWQTSGNGTLALYIEPCFDQRCRQELGEEAP